MGLDDLAVPVLHQVGAVAVQHPGLAGTEGCGVAAGLEPLARRLDAVDGDVVLQEGVEQADGVGAAPDAGHKGVRQPARLPQDLLPGLAADHGLKVAHHRRVGVGTGDRADDVEGVVDVGDPVAHRLVERVLQGLGARLHADHLGTEQAHAVDVRLLPRHVDGPHVDHALEPEAGRHRGGRDAVLAGAGLGDDPGLAHPLGEQRLADGVVHLVRAGVVEVLPLEPDLAAAVLPAEPLREVEGRGAADVVREVLVQLRQEVGVLQVSLVGAPELVQGRHQGLGHEHAAVGAEVPPGVGHGREIQLFTGRHV